MLRIARVRRAKVLSCEVSRCVSVLRFGAGLSEVSSSEELWSGRGGGRYLPVVRVCIYIRGQEVEGEIRRLDDDCIVVYQRRRTKRSPLFLISRPPLVTPLFFASVSARLKRLSDRSAKTKAVVAHGINSDLVTPSRCHEVIVIA